VTDDNFKIIRLSRIDLVTVLLDRGKMPHSIEAEAMSSPSNVKDEPVEETGISDNTPNATEGDTKMSDTEDVKKEVKQLEDLFADVDSDDEFPTSSAAIQPSSPVAPLL
jgi:DNA primase small subunit